jgi:predicted nuclease of predicted toxin-antitoxin system
MRHLSVARWERIRPVFAALLSNVTFVSVYYTWRPTWPDRGDEHVIDCAMNAGATIVTLNLKDFKNASANLGLRVVSPVELVARLAAALR